MKDICEYNGKVYTRKNLKVKSSKAENLELSNAFIRAKK